MAQQMMQQARQSEEPQVHEVVNPNPQQAMGMARESVNRMDGPATDEAPASPEEQAEYERAQAGLSKIIYENKETSTAVIDMLRPEEKVGSVAQAAIMVITQLDGKLDLDENVFAQLTMETVDRLVDLAEQVKDMEFSDQDVQGALGAAWEGIMQIYQDPESAATDYEEFTQGMSEDDLAAQTSSYKQFLGE